MDHHRLIHPDLVAPPFFTTLVDPVSSMQLTSFSFFASDGGDDHSNTCSIITPEDITAITTRFPLLEKLSLDGHNFTEQNAKDISGLKYLKSLELRDLYGSILEEQGVGSLIAHWLPLFFNLLINRNEDDYAKLEKVVINNIPPFHTGFYIGLEESDKRMMYSNSRFLKLLLDFIEKCVDVNCKEICLYDLDVCGLAEKIELAQFR